MEREVNVITHGDIEIKLMSEAERKAFMAALLVRVWELHRKEKEAGHGA